MRTLVSARSARWFTTVSLISIAASLGLACNPLVFDDLSNDASTRVMPRPDNFSSRFAFGSVMEAYEVRIGTAPAESRLAVSGGAGSPIVIYPGWVGSDTVLGAALTNKCDDAGDCRPGAGSALVGVSSFGGGREGCLLMTATDEGGFSVYCESDDSTLDYAGTRPDEELGASGESLGRGHAIGVAILGAPRANGGAGGLYGVGENGALTPLAIPPGTAPSGSRLGRALAVSVIDTTSALIAATAPEAGRVVVLTAGAAGDPAAITIHACIEEAVPGFGGSVALGDVDGDGAMDVIVGNEGETATDVRVYAGSAMPASGCGAWGAAATTIACPDGLDGALCNGAGFGAAVGAGDLNGDGVDDVVVGAPFATVGDAPRAGAVFHFPGAVGGVDAGGATARTHSEPTRDDTIGGTIELLPAGLSTTPRVEPVAGAVGRQAVLAFLCSGLEGDRPEDTDLVGARCTPR